jgi:hypothetical protein
VASDEERVSELERNHLVSVGTRHFDPTVAHSPRVEIGPLQAFLVPRPTANVEQSLGCLPTFRSLRLQRVCSVLAIGQRSLQQIPSSLVKWPEFLSSVQH